MTTELPNSFYEQIKPRLHERVAREVQQRSQIGEVWINMLV